MPSEPLGRRLTVVMIAVLCISVVVFAAVYGQPTTGKGPGGGCEWDPDTWQIVCEPTPTPVPPTEVPTRQTPPPTATYTSVPTVPPTATYTSVPTATFTSVPTATWTPTPGPTDTPTKVPTPSHTPTPTPTPGQGRPSTQTGDVISGERSTRKDYRWVLLEWDYPSGSSHTYTEAQIQWSDNPADGWNSVRSGSYQPPAGREPT